MKKKIDWFGPQRGRGKKKKGLFTPAKLPTRKNVRKVKKKNLTWPQAVVKYPKVTMFGDADKDGKLNMFDCKPFDKTRHGRSKLYNKDMMKRIGHILPSVKQEERRRRQPKLRRKIEREQKHVGQILASAKGMRNVESQGPRDWQHNVLEWGSVDVFNMDIMGKDLRGYSKEDTFHARFDAIKDPSVVRSKYKQREKELNAQKKAFIKEHGLENYKKGIKEPDERRKLIRHFQKFPEDISAVEKGVSKIEIKTAMKNSGDFHPVTKAIRIKATGKAKQPRRLIPRKRDAGAENTISHEIEHANQWSEGYGPEMDKEGVTESGGEKHWDNQPIEIDAQERTATKAMDHDNKDKPSPEALQDYDKDYGSFSFQSVENYEYDEGQKGEAEYLAREQERFSELNDEEDFDEKED